MKVHVRTIALLFVLLLTPGMALAQSRLPFENLMRKVQGRYKYVHGSAYSWPGCCYGSGSAPDYPPDGFYGDYIGPNCAKKLTNAIVTALKSAADNGAFLKEEYWNLEGTQLDPTAPAACLRSADLGFYSGLVVTRDNYQALFALAQAGVVRLKKVANETSYVDVSERGGDGRVDGLDNQTTCGAALPLADARAIADWNAASWTTPASTGINKFECAGAAVDTDPDPDVASAYVKLANVKGKVQMDLSSYPITTILTSASGDLYLSTGHPLDGPSNSPPVTTDQKWHAFGGSSAPTVYQTNELGGPERTVLTIDCAGAMCQGPPPEIPVPCCKQKGWYIISAVGIVELTFRETADSGGPCTIDVALPPWLLADPPVTEADASNEKSCGVGGPGGPGGGPGGAGGIGNGFPSGPGLPSPNKKASSDPGGRNGKGASASGSDPEWDHPIQLATGHKIERAVDLAIALPGSTFVVNRGYCSNPALQEGNGIFGARWSMSIFSRLQVGTSDIRFIGSTLQNAVVLVPQTGGVWRANGASRQTLTETTATINGTGYPVYRLSEPGAWRMDFHRTTNHLNGLLLQEVDLYGNRQTYSYKTFDELNNSPYETVRLESIFLNGEDADDCAAQIMLEWHLPNLPEEPTIAATTLGKLHSIHAYRFDAQRTRTLIQQVTYHYKEGEADFLGTGGDLIQVISRERVDQSTELPFRTRITQYRYHNGTTPSSSDPRIAVSGAAHELKHVILPEQIEYLAQKLYPSTYTRDAVELAAGTLLGKDDDQGAAGVNVVDMPSKIVSYSSNKVTMQYIQTACGCSGGSQGTKEDFTYFASGVYASVKIVESMWSGSAYVAYRNHYCDMKYLGGVPYLVTYALQDANATSKIWAWHYDYEETTTRTVQRMMYPSALATSGYTPASSGTPASYTASTTSGLVYGWTYSPDHQVVETRCAEGNLSSLSSFTLLSKTTYPSSSGSNSRTWLPSQVELYTSATSTADPTVEKSIFTYDFHSGDIIAWVRTQVESELKEENGPDSPTTYDSYELFNAIGQNTWSRSADNVLTKREFDAYSGAITSITRNASNSTMGTWPNLTVTSWGREAETGSGGALTTTYTLDKLGRVTSRTAPGSVSSYTLRAVRQDSERPGIGYYAVLSLPHKLAGTSEWDGPISVGWYNAGGRGTRSSDYTVGGALYAPLSLTYTEGTEIARATTQHHLSGLVQSRKEWHNVANPTTDFYISQFEYDTLGRLSIAKSPVAGSDTPTLTRHTYDVMNRTIKVEVGTDSGGSGDMTDVAEYFFDGGGSAAQGVGDGYLTFIRQITGEASSGGLATEYRDTKRTFDYRGRLQIIERPSQPHEYIVHDNQDRVIKRGLYSSVPSGIGGTTDSTRGLYVENYFSQRGLPYRQRVAINAADIGNTTPNTNGFLETNSWFDAAGHAIAEWAPNAPGTKRQFDAHGRAKVVYITDRGGDDAPGSTGNYADVVNGTTPELTGDRVIEQTEFTYGTASQAWPDRLMLVKTARRNHNADSGSYPTGALSTSNAVVSYTGYYYDTASRRMHTADFGTNATADVFENGSAPTWPPSPLVPPSYSTGTKIVSGVEFNSRGLVARTIDPKERVSEYRYDDLSRRIAVIENAQGSIGSLSITWSTSNGGEWAVSGLNPTTNPDHNRVTSFVYDASGNTVKQIAHTSDSTSQVTKYTYSTTKNANTSDTNSLVSTRGSLLNEVAYPNESGGQPGTTTEYKVTYAYNRLGELRSVIDQNETKHVYKRDASGRVLEDNPTLASGSTIDNTVKRISVDYDEFGRLEWVKSIDNLGTGNVRNEVEFAYTKLWQVSKVYQNVQGEVAYDGSGVPTGSTVVVSYGYGNVAAPTSGSDPANFSRLTSMTYPNGNVVNYGYGTAGGLDDRISRARSLADPSDSDNIVEYSRVGLDLFAVVDYPLADVQLDRTFSRDGKRSLWSTQGTSLYPGWDRHGRVAIHAWMDGNLDEGTNGLPTRPPIVDEGYSYDKSSNRLTKYDMRPGALPAATKPDWQYTYDGLDRLTEAKKGDRSAGTFTATVGSQKWTLDVLGNWVKHQKELGGSTLYGDAGETEDRTHNEANEITNRYPNGSSGSPTLPFAYDAAGNLKQENYTAGQYHLFKHDAWNRLVKHEFGGSPAPSSPTNAIYEYNGLHWRTMKIIPEGSSGAETEGGDDDSGSGGIIREMYYSAAWQLIEERIDEDYGGSPGVDRIAQEVWGLRYIDDAVLRIAAVGDGGGSDPRRFYHLTDVQFSTVAMLGLGGTYAPLHERVSYDPYGKATHRWAGDVNDDGAVNSTDRALIQNAAATELVIWQSGYDARMDLDRDGDIDNDDVDIATGLGDAAALTTGEISDRGSAGPDNVFGYDGYVFAPENQRYCVRFRWYDPGTGRWMERDPAGYVDGLSLYEYSIGSPLVYSDSLGLAADDDPFRWVDDVVERRGAKTSIYDCMTLGEMPGVLPEVIDALEYLACVAHCVKNNPEKLAAALAKAGWNVGKSKVEDFLGIFSVLTFIEFNEEGDPVTCP